jgi:Skp family chaperone for outer membrane proteins
MLTHIRSLALLGALVLAAWPAYAQTAPAPRPAGRGSLSPPSIAVVNTVLLQEQASAMKSIKEQMQKEEASLKGEFDKREKDLRSADQDLQQQRTLLSADAFADRRRTFEQQLGESQRYMAGRKRQLDLAFADGMRQVDIALNGILKEIAAERGLNLIAPKNSFLLADEALDITDDVRQRLDKKLPRVAIKLPPLPAPDKK